MHATKRWMARLCTAVAALGVCAVGCGPAVHNEVAERARQWFYEQKGAPNAGRVAFYRGILHRHSESLQAGVVFPDWGYGCLSMDEQAEAAHWTPFMEYGVEYLASKYQKPYGERAQQLIAFLFGVASHQVADEQWHGLSGLKEGIMQVLANSTFDGEYSRAHDTLDVGGDFAMAHMSDLGYMLDRWSVPIDDVIEIYRSMGLDTPRWKLNLCITRQFYAMEAVKRFGQGLFPSYASRAPMLTERLEDYYIGGLFAMATATNGCWYSLVDWFENGNFTNKCLLADRHPTHGNNSSGAGSTGSRASAGLHKHGPRTTAQQLLDRIAQHFQDQQWMQHVHSSTAVYEDGGMLYLSANMSTPSLLQHRDRTSYFTAKDSRQHRFAAKSSRRTVHKHGSERSKVGTDNKCTELTKLYPKAKVLYSLSAYSGFGTDIAMGDFKGNGQISVAISAPYYKTSSVNEGSGEGAVFVVDNPELFYEFSQQNIADAGPLVLAPAGSTDGDKVARYSLFGSSLAVVDFNADGIDDLVVGSSGFGEDATGSMLGRVDVYLGHAGSGLSHLPDFVLTARQLALHTDSPWSHQRIGGFLFGEDVNNDGFADLVIGAPYHSDLPYEQHAGRVFGYISKRDRASGSHEMGPPDFTVSSPKRSAFEWFGFAAKAVHLKGFDASLLLVGAPGYKSQDASANHTLAGKVYAFTMPKDSRASPIYEGLEFTSLKDITQLGSQIHIWKADDADATVPIVLFGSPSEQNAAMSQHLGHENFSAAAVDQASPERGWQAGEVRVIDPLRWVKQAQAESKARGSDEKDTIAGLLSVLRGRESPGHFGKALATTGSEVWIGEPFSNVESGRIYRWRPDFDAAECFYMPNEVGRSRLGHKIKIKRNPDRELLVVAMPHDSQFSRLTGSVLLLQK